MLVALTRCSALLALALPIACGDGDVDPPIQLRGACATADRLGGFRIESHAALDPAFSSISGSIKDAVNPVDVREEIAADGGCRLLRRNNPFCEPSCLGGELCNFDGECVPFPVGVDVGGVSIRGLVTELEVSPLVPGNAYSATDVPHPLFLPGSEIRLRSSGPEPLAIDGIGSEALVVSGDSWVITDGDPVDVAWNAPASSTETTIGLTLSIDQHGTTPVALVCEFPDSGDAEVSASMVSSLFAAGVSGFANASLERRTVDSQEFAGGCADLAIAHPVRHPASVSGHSPCNGPNQCPTGQSCDLGSQTCIDD